MEEDVLLKSLKLTNFLSFGESAQTLELRPLNVVIGPNGSGKSNLIDAISLLLVAPTERGLRAAIGEGGGVRNWLWKGAVEQRPEATLEVDVCDPTHPEDLVYSIGFIEEDQRFTVLNESVRRGLSPLDPGKPESFAEFFERPDSYYFYSGELGICLLNSGGERHKLTPEEISSTSSILARRRDPKSLPELTYLGDAFRKIRIYRDWSFGRHSPERLPQKTDMPNDVLELGVNSNLGLVLNRLRRDPAVKKRLLDALRALYDGIDDFDVQIEGGTVQVFFHEGRHTIPASRLSDGTLRYLCLLAILCHPTPGPLICIEEPELGLHPDVLPGLADLLKDAAERTQLIVTTHSDVLVDALTDQPESVIVAGRGPEGTTLNRLDAEKLKPWLEKYRLGELW
ncbi:MAG: AAA family ATPase, partial [Candidatus Accumulibacter sp.]|nr:AAA family ATPase [Accumulibacter sp.]